MDFIKITVYISLLVQIITGIFDYLRRWHPVCSTPRNPTSHQSWLRKRLQRNRPTRLPPLRSPKKPRKSRPKRSPGRPPQLPPNLHCQGQERPPLPKSRPNPPPMRLPEPPISTTAAAWNKDSPAIPRATGWRRSAISAAAANFKVSPASGLEKSA